MNPIYTLKSKNMKLISLLSFMLILSINAFSQHIFHFSNFYYLTNTGISGSIDGYGTHFHQADSTKVTFESATDTVSFWVANTYISDDDQFNFHVTNKHFAHEGLYSLKIMNSIDGEMLYGESIYVKSQAFASVLTYGIYYGNRPRVQAGSTREITYFSWLTLDSTKLGAVYYLGHNNDTIRVDSVHLSAPDASLTLKIVVPSTSQSGYYNLLVEYGQDTLLWNANAVFIDNPMRTQIAFVSPDSMNNLPFTTTEITVFGNNTHFTNDSNMILPFFNIPCDSTKVISDTVLKAYVFFPPPVKTAVYTNANIKIYNPTDGFLEYPIQIDFYGSIDNANNYSHIKVFPNPASDYIALESKEFLNDPIRISISSLNGCRIKDLAVKNKQYIKIDVNDLAAGVYLLKIQGLNKQKVIKFIKK